MKQLFASLIFISVAFYSYSQEYTPFPEADAIWSVNIDNFAVHGDTTINSKEYKKYYRTNGDSTFAFENSVYYAAVREDLNKRIWGIKHDSLTERLLYDFSLEIGDTTFVYPYEDFNNWVIDSVGLIVLNIDSVLIDTTFRKRFKISTIDVNFDQPGWVYEYWIEGIGSTIGLFSQGTFQPGVVDVSFYELLCYQENDFTEYFATYYTNYEACYMPVFESMLDESIERSKMELYPNPLTDISKIKISNFVNKEAYVEFYNIYGQLVKSDTFENNKNEIIINRNEFKEGFYLYRVYANRQIIGSGKLIVK
jgi:hypothetical protein